MITFGDYGKTAHQRLTGHSFAMLINVMKLYETERNFTGRKAQIPFPWRDKCQKPLFLDLESYYVQGSDLDRNIIQSVW